MAIILYDSDGNACVVRRPVGFDRSIEMQPIAPSEVALDSVPGTLQVRTPEWWEFSEERLRSIRG